MVEEFVGNAGGGKTLGFAPQVWDLEGMEIVGNLLGMREVSKTLGFGEHALVDPYPTYTLLRSSLGN